MCVELHAIISNSGQMFTEVSMCPVLGGMFLRVWISLSLLNTFYAHRTTDGNLAPLYYKSGQTNCFIAKWQIGQI